MGIMTGMRSLKEPSVLPGFGITLGLTLAYLSLIVLIPLSGLFVTTAQVSFDEFWKTVTAARVMNAYRITFGASFLAAFINVFFGLIVTWVLVRYKFPGKRIMDAHCGHVHRRRVAELADRKIGTCHRVEQAGLAAGRKTDNA